MSKFSVDSTLVVIPARGGSKRIPNKNIKEIFGQPAFEGKGDKITTEWVVRWENEDEDEFGYFSLYDWRYGRDFNDDYSRIEWNIGGKSFDDWCAADDIIKPRLEAA